MARNLHNPQIKYRIIIIQFYVGYKSLYYGINYVVVDIIKTDGLLYFVEVDF